jgi:hypothetical protein
VASSGGKKIDRSFLGEAALRLSRVFGFGGAVSPEFDSGEKIQPVVLVADATQPGYRGQQLRGFAFGQRVAAVAGNTSKLWVMARRDSPGVIIDGVHLATGAVPAAIAEWRLSILGAADPDPVVIGQTITRWTERSRLANGDIAPVLTLGEAVDALSFGLDIATGCVPASGSVTLPLPLVLEPGGKLIFSSITLAVTWHFSFWGRAL